jgi:hypothetical protein
VLTYELALVLSRLSALRYSSLPAISVLFFTVSKLLLIGCTLYISPGFDRVELEAICNCLLEEPGNSRFCFLMSYKTIALFFLVAKTGVADKSSAGLIADGLLVISLPYLSFKTGKLVC